MTSDDRGWPRLTIGHFSQSWANVLRNVAYVAYTNSATTIQNCVRLLSAYTVSFYFKYCSLLFDHSMSHGRKSPELSTTIWHRGRQAYAIRLECIIRSCAVIRRSNARELSVIAELLVWCCCADCADGWWGVDCSVRCNCSVKYSEGCDAVTGQCHCRPGHTGHRCTERTIPSAIITLSLYF